MEPGSHSIFDPQPTVNSYYDWAGDERILRTMLITRQEVTNHTVVQNLKAVVSVTSQLPSSWTPKVDVFPGGHEASLDAIQRQMCVVYPIKYHPYVSSRHFVLGPSNTSEI